MIGCDPEFNVLSLDGKKLKSGDFFPTTTGAQVGCDGDSGTGPGELRPTPTTCPLELTRNIKHLMNKVSVIIGDDKKITTGGGKGIASIGHHIHFNIPYFEKELKEMLDIYIGYPSSKIDGADRGSSQFGIIGKDDVREKTHGVEYRTPASSLHPELTDALHVTAFCIVEKWESINEGEKFEFQVDDTTNIPTREAYLSLDYTRDKKFSPYLEEYWKWVTRQGGRKIDTKRDCLWRWVSNRKEVKEVPGLRIIWEGDIKNKFENLKNFFEVQTLDKVYEVNVYQQDIINGMTEGVEYTQSIYISMTKLPPKNKKLNTEFEKYKQKYKVYKITGNQEEGTPRINITKDLVDIIGKNLDKAVLDLGLLII